VLAVLFVRPQEEGGGGNDPREIRHHQTTGTGAWPPTQLLETGPWPAGHRASRSFAVAGKAGGRVVMAGLPARGRKKGRCGRSELWRRPACRLAHDLGRTELRGVTVSRARWRGCKREALPVDPLELGHAGVR
jgi:hypothetical protein